ncbi:RE1, partial [Symbiodinium sp. CCMP2456]
PGGIPDPWASIWEGLYGKFGSRAKAGATRAETPQQRPRLDEAQPMQSPPQNEPGVPSQSATPPQGILEALAQGMQQLQDLQLKAMKKSDSADEAPEVVKTATVSLPELKPPVGEMSGLLLQDWLVQVTTAMQDLSSGSGDWWEQVRERVGETYATWLAATPLERLQINPDEHSRLVTGKWTRVNARACALMMQSFPEVVKSDLISRRSTQSAVMVMFRLYTTYQPGGAAERGVVLKHLQGEEAPGDVTACLNMLRSWPRWLQRCRDMNMTVPDGTLLARSLTTAAGKFLAENPDAVFRTQLVRSTYRIDAQPKIEDVVRYQQHLQAEIENIVISKATAGGCRRGSKCPFQHSFEGLSKQEKAKKCLACGAEDHRQRECPTKQGRSAASAGSSTRGAEDRSPQSSTASPKAAAINKAQLEPEGEKSPTKTNEADVLPGHPVLSWEALLQAAAKVAGAGPPSEAKAPSIRVMSIHGGTPASFEESAYALVDSGATHPLRRAKSSDEWRDSSPVLVHLAGGESVELRMNSAGTLLVPLTGSTRSASTSPIVPLGSLVGVLGYKLEWYGSRCRLTSRDGEVLTLRVRDGCPEITERQALELIARIEDRKLETLQTATASTKAKIRESMMVLNKSWFDHLISYCNSGIGSEALLAIHGAPFFQDLPEQSLFGLSEADPISNGWDALRGLQHLSRRRRKKLWSSRHWVVHLYSGRTPNEEVMFLERQGFAVLELDIEQGKSHDVCNPLVWRALEWAARRCQGTPQLEPTCRYVTFTVFVVASSPMLNLQSGCCECQQSSGKNTLGPLKVPGLDADGRGAFPKPYKYMFVAKLVIPKTFVDDGRGVGVEYDPGELEALSPPAEDAFDYEDPVPEGEESAHPPLPRDDEEIPDGDEEESDDRTKKHLSPEEDLDMSGPETVSLLFSTGLPDNKGSTVLEAIQDVVMYCWALNIPIVRFHCDRGMEFYAKATRQWIKFHGMRFTTSEGGLHQQNGMVENAVRYIKQRARTLLIGSKLPQRLWPQAVNMAATIQRASALGMEARLVAPFGAKVLVRKREYGGVAESGKPDDLAPRWLEGRYLGLSETLRRGHVIYVANEDGEKFVHTVNVRVGLEDPVLPEPGLEAELPRPPSRRLRDKSRGSGDVVAVSKAQVVTGSEDLKEKTLETLSQWSPEEAAVLALQVALSLNPAERIYGVFRHGGRVGLTKATYDKPWVAELFARIFLDRCPEAEFSAVYVSVNTSKELHVDSNNLTGMPNYVCPLALPRSGGDLWIELKGGDVVQGKITEMIDQRGIPRYGCIQPLSVGEVVVFNPHKRHAVLPWKGLRVVLVGYTPGVPQNLKTPEREILSRLGFPVPSGPEEDGMAPMLRALRVQSLGSSEKVLEEEEHLDGELVSSDGSMLYPAVCPDYTQDLRISDGSRVAMEEVEYWDMYLPLEEGDPQDVPKALIASCDRNATVAKAEVGFTKNIEELLGSLTGPLTVAHNVDPGEATGSFDNWVPAVKKELGSFEGASRRVRSDDPQVVADLKDGVAKIVPMKVVYTVKPPSEEAVSNGQWYRRKARIVACGNMMAESGEDTYAAAAPAEVVRSSLSVSSLFDWEAAVLDVTAAFLQTPLNEVQCKQRILGQPPRALVRAGLCHPRELWEFTHAIYGLRESPRWWGEFRDTKMAQLNIVVGTRRIKLLQCRVESSWWRLVEDDKALVGLVVIYVDDLLICSTPTIINAVSKAVKSLWETSSLSWASDGGIRFLGIEITKIQGGFALNQEPYIKELTRIHSIAPTQLNLVPVGKEQSSFTADSEEAVFTTAELREAQQVAGEILWVSQRTRPDIAYVASLISSLSARAPRRAVAIAKKCMAFLQRTAQQQLRIKAKATQLIAWADASYAPDGGRSHTGWLITLGEAPINWRSARQSTITLSTAESELGASVEGALALMSVEALLSELRLDLERSRILANTPPTDQGWVDLRKAR